MTGTDQFSLEPRAFPVCPASPQCSPDEPPHCHGLFEYLEVQARGDAAATAHLLAVADSQHVVEQAESRLSAASDTLISAVGRADSALSRLATSLQEGRILRPAPLVAAVEAQRVADGAFDRSRRLLPGRWTAEVLIVVAALFDTAFLGSLFRFLINADERDPIGRLLTVIAYFPGAVLAAALLVTGLWLGEAVERYRVRQAEWHDAEATPRPEWLLPLVLLTLLLVTVGSVASLRPRFAQLSAAVDQQAIPSWVIVLLLVMLSLTAIAAKVAGHNSYARRLEIVECEVAFVKEADDALRRSAVEAVAEHEQRWRDLRDLVLALTGQVQDLWTTVAHQQDRSTQPHVVVAPEGGSTESAVTALAQHVPVPPPPGWGRLLGAARTADRHLPERSRRRLEELTRQADEQWSAHSPTTGASADAGRTS